MAELRFDGKVVIITGAGNGMGKSHALLLARRGAYVVVNDVGANVGGRGTSCKPAEQVAEEITAAGGTAVASTDTVVTATGCESIVSTAIKHFGRVDAVVHNAGILTRVPLPGMDEESFNAMLNVHLRGGVNVTKAAWNHMVAAGGGRFLYIVSGAGLFGLHDGAHYAAAKAGLVALSRVTHLEGRAVGIRANALAVGALTRMSSVTGERRSWWEKYMTPEAVSPAVAWLIHEDCPASGECYDSSGGRVARVFIAETRGFIKLRHTPEDLRDHWDDVQSPTNWFVPQDVNHLFRYIETELQHAGAQTRNGRDEFSEVDT